MVESKQIYQVPKSALLLAQQCKRLCWIIITRVWNHIQLHQSIFQEMSHAYWKCVSVWCSQETSKAHILQGNTTSATPSQKTLPSCVPTLQYSVYAGHTCVNDCNPGAAGFLVSFGMLSTMNNFPASKCLKRNTGEYISLIFQVIKIKSEMP